MKKIRNMARIIVLVLVVFLLNNNLKSQELVLIDTSNVTIEDDSFSTITIMWFKFMDLITLLSIVVKLMA